LASIGTWWGQVLLAAGSVFFLVLTKAFTRRTNDRRQHDRAIRWPDDFAVGCDLLVLSAVTTLAYYATQSRAIETAYTRNDRVAIDLANEHQDKAFVAFLISLVMLFSVGWLIQRPGKRSREERAAWKRDAFETRVAAGPLAERQRTNPDTTEVDLVVELALEIEEPPEYRFWWGVFWPDAIGLFVLILAIQAVTQ
jgi:hypothetical protein